MALLRPGHGDPCQRLADYAAALQRRREGLTPQVASNLAAPLSEFNAMNLGPDELRQFIQHTPAAVAVFDRQMRYIEYSERWLQDYGLTDQDLHGRSHYEVFPEINDDWKRIHARCLSGAIEHCEEDEFSRKDGSMDYVKWAIHPWHRGDGDIGGIVMYTEVITEKKRAETALRESEERFRLLIENQRELVVKVDPKGYYQFVSPTYCDTFGKSEAELLGKQFWPFVHPDDLKMTETAMASLYSPPYECYMEQRALTKSGWRWFAWADKALVSENGEVTAIIGVGRDVTDRKAAEAALKESEARYRAVVENQTELICRTDKKGNLVFVNDAYCSYFDRAREELLGRNLFSLLAPQSEERVRRMMSLLDAENELVSGEFELTGGDGKPRWQQWTSRILFDESGESIGFQAVGRDVTDRKRVERRLRELARELRAERETLKEKNAALNQVLSHIERERQEFKLRICQDVENAVKPVLQRIRKTLNSSGATHLEELQIQLENALAKDVDVFRDRYGSLTPRELEICELIKAGTSSKQIAEALSLSLFTVHKHREQIRKKLGLTNKSVNLSSYLRSH
jgi:PAS domain S-box-containing protein